MAGETADASVEIEMNSRYGGYPRHVGVNLEVLNCLSEAVDLAPSLET